MSARTRKLRPILAAYVLIALCLLGFEVYAESRATALGAERLEGTTADYSSEVWMRRAAGFCRAGFVLATTMLALALGVLFAPGPLRLVSGNLAVLLAILLAVEVATRLLKIHVPAIGRPGQTGDFGLWVYDETKGWFHAPSTTAERSLGGPDRGRVRINRLGLRGSEVQLDRQEVTRVLVVGDSFVFGLGVDEENLLTAHLERWLEPYFPAGVEVVNMGVPGYSTDQEYLLWRDLGPLLHPAAVVLVVCDNDYLGNTESFAWRQYYKPYFELEANGELQLRNVPVPRLSRVQRVKLWLGRESNLWNFVRSREPENAILRSFIDWFQVDVSRRPRGPYRTTRAIVKSFAREAEDAGAWFLVTSTGRRAEDPALFQGLSRFLKLEGIHHFDLFPILHAARLREPDRFWDFPSDTHWNRDAHELAARSIFEYMRAHYLEPREEDSVAGSEESLLPGGGALRERSAEDELGAVEVGPVKDQALRFGDGHGNGRGQGRRHRELSPGFLARRARALNRRRHGVVAHRGASRAVARGFITR